ncbi:DNA binding domain-containing protein, excisionase family [Amycolatopsis sacchari]|uniref:DNA binding domain-containing protein, excisionase family n=1 Tax=Amycolatopsis sacchari TaxID=115433 RepID=A0A1I3VAQ9_9PSEU|nr:helix-turn-helix domain-containing protein [Amycolatopsis sacchari]SFJ91277.1 DNA binding domain-containing protein, excisionase family [Amycolatopsis sacchari]
METASIPTEDPTSPRVLLTVEDAAKALSIGRTTMYALIKAGHIATVQIGQLRRVPTTALAAYVQQLTTQQSAA